MLTGKCISVWEKFVVVEETGSVQTQLRYKATGNRSMKTVVPKLGLGCNPEILILMTGLNITE